MKNLLVLIIIVFSLAGINQAQNKSLEKAAHKYAKKEARKLEKEGFKAKAGYSLYEMLKKTYIYERQTVNMGGGNMQRFIKESGTVLGGSIEAAERHAEANAKEKIVANIKSEIEGHIKSQVANAQLSMNDAESINEMASSFKTITAGEVSGIKKTFVAYKPKGNNVEVQVIIFYDIAKETKEKIIERLRNKFKDEPDFEKEIKKAEAIPLPGIPF